MRTTDALRVRFRVTLTLSESATIRVGIALLESFVVDNSTVTALQTVNLPGYHADASHNKAYVYLVYYTPITTLSYWRQEAARSTWNLFLLDETARAHADASHRR
mmetsp:Transcript_5130/g.11312  ORF Transcript_5130/g.11312 Transcript_5130/m.11312 type:complete len:105 (-) Transcript_5130:262-576(-)